MKLRHVLLVAVGIVSVGVGSTGVGHLLPENAWAAEKQSNKTKSPQLKQYFDLKIYHQSQKAIKKMKTLKKQGIEMALVPLPYTAFIKAPAGSRVVVKQGKQVYYDKVVKNGVAFLTTDPKKPFNINRSVAAYAKLPGKAVSATVHYRFESYPGYQGLAEYIL